MANAAYELETQQGIQWDPQLLRMYQLMRPATDTSSRSTDLLLPWLTKVNNFGEVRMETMLGQIKNEKQGIQDRIKQCHVGYNTWQPDLRGEVGYKNQIKIAKSYDKYVPTTLNLNDLIYGQYPRDHMNLWNPQSGCYDCNSTATLYENSGEHIKCRSYIP